jgi:HSP20 family protein
MSLISWDPLREMEQMLSRQSGRRGLAREGSGQESMLVADWAPLVDIHETDDEYVIRAELPEVKKDDVSISISNDTLVIEGTRSAEKEEKNKKFHRIERSYGRFARSFAIPENVDVDKIEAEHNEGMLNVHLPKAKTPPQKSVKIKVK